MYIFAMMKFAKTVAFDRNVQFAPLNCTISHTKTSSLFGNIFYLLTLGTGQLCFC